MTIEREGKAKCRQRSSDRIKGPVEAALAIHVLAILPLQDHLNCAMEGFFVAKDMFAFSSLKAAEAHQLHHFGLLFRGVGGERVGCYRFL